MKDIRDKVLNWLGTGRVGSSSKAMALTAVNIICDKNHPCDPSDFNRCLLLLDEIPEIREHFDNISAISVVWSGLISRWDEVEKCFTEEVGLDWSKGTSAPKTYKLMKDIGC